MISTRTAPTYLKPGSVLGEIGLFGHGIRTARVTAAEPTQLFRMTYNQFKNLEKKHIGLVWAFHKHIIRVMSLRMEHDSMQRMKI